MSKKLLNVCLTAILCLTGTTVWAIDKTGDAYQIGSAGDLRAFAELVNGGETLANAVLTADVVCDADMPMIGSDANRFDGVFDGQGHTVTLDAYPTVNGSGLFQYIGWKGVVKNLVVDGQITTGNSFAGGIAGYNRGTITSCISKVTINSSKSGDGTHGGIVGIQYIGGKLINCLAAGEIVGEATTNCGGLIGWLDARCIVMNNLSLTKMRLATNPDNTRSVARNAGNIRVGMNLYLTREKDTSDDEGIQITEEELKNGNACFVLNSDQSNIVWTQTLGEDEYPVPFNTHKQVFANGTVADCAGNVGEGTVFNNEGGAEAPKHVMVGGKCQNCYYWNPFLAERDAEGFFLLKDKDCVDWFVKDHELGGEYHSARLMTDVDYKDRTAFLSPSYWFSGEFDGNGHTLEIALPDNEIENNAPFPNICGATISNLAVKGTVETSKKFAAGLVGHANSTPVNYLKNILVDVQIISTIEGDGTHGTIIGVPNAETYMTNCISVGSITTPNGLTDMCGGLVGYAGAATHLRNCAFLGNLDVAFNITYDSDIISRNSGNCTFENVYYLQDLMPGVSAPKAVTQTTQDNVKNGILAYQLNGDQEEIGIWQTIGTDPYPTPIKGQSQQVYASPSGGYRCDGKPLGSVTYSNTFSERVIPDHTWDGTFCSVCGVFNSDFKQPNADGFYELATAKDLVWFSYKVNKEGNADAKALLTDDITMEDEDNAQFQPIGNVSVKYIGTFDGQFHRIHNLKIERPDDYTGMFGMVTGGVVIKNLVLAEDCLISGGAFTGLIGGSNGSGQVLMECLGNEGEVISAAQNAGGIYGCNMGAAATPIFRNCYVTGPVKGAKESGQITGYAGNGQAYNCYASGTIEGVYYTNMADCMLRGGPASQNCYSTAGKDNKAELISQEDVENGTLAWLLNGERFDEVTFRQTLGEDNHPVFDADHGVVYKFGDELGYVLGDDIDGIRDALIAGELSYIQSKELYAEVGLKTAYEAKVNGLESVSTMEDLVAVYNELKADKAVINECAASYQAYIKKVNETIDYLAGHHDFEGGDRDFLEDYLQSDAEPSEENPNGGALYILDTQLLTKEEIEAETKRIDALLTTAIQNGFVAGTEVTQFMTNPDFHDGFNGWEGQKGTGVDGFELGEEGSTKTYYGAEHIARTTLDMYQTIQMPKKGYYLFSLDAAYRPANSFYSYSHGANIYANGVKVFIPTVHEVMMPIDEAVDGVNCNLTGGTNDQPIYLNPADPVEEEIEGYGLHGRLSVAIAIMAGRMPNYIIGEVGEDCMLTVGVNNPHGYASTNEWVGFGNAKLIFLGETLDSEAAATALTQTLEGDLARANTILTLYNFSDDTDYASAPNYTLALKDELQALVNEAGSASEPAAKYEVIKKFSDLFGRIYESRMAYAGMFGRAEGLSVAADEMRDLLGEEQANALSDAAQKALADYSAGLLTTEEAQAALTDIDLLPQKVDGVYQIKTAVHMALFAANVNAGETDASAMLMNDIDMGGKLLEDGTPDPEGYFFTPIGTINNKPYAGTFDGQGHTIKNLVIDTGAEYTGLFGGVTGGAVIKDFIIDKNSYIGGAAFTAVVGGNNTAGNIYVEKIGMEGRVVSSAQNAAGIYGCNNGNAGTPHILNCYVTGHVTGARESAQVCGWMGANGSEIIGCWAIGEIDGVYNTAAGAGDAFYRGTAGTAANCFSNASARNNTVDTYREADAKSGKMTFQLNQGETENPAWYQTLGEDPLPVFDKTHKIVYMNEDGTYTNERTDLSYYDGTEENPFRIASVAQFCSLINYLKPSQMNYVVLENDLDMNDVTTWIPINCDQAVANYQNYIHFDGQGHVIKNFHPRNTDQQYQSIFGIMCGTVKNLGVENADVNCPSTGTGILCAWIGRTATYSGVSYVDHCWVTGKLDCGGYAGAIAGAIAGPGFIRNCYANTDITSTSDLTGGLVGRVRGELSIENAYAAGSCNRGGGIIGGGQQDATPACLYNNIVVWNNTAENFGPTANADKVSNISYYNGSNFADLQQTVVGWDSSVWYCGMGEGEYPVLIGVGTTDLAMPQLNKEDVIYTLTGVRVQKAQKGIYIINGKKTYVK